jgi:hypothetical protein
MSTDSSVGITPGYVLDARRVKVRVPVGANIFLFSASSIPDLRPIQPPIKWISEVLSLPVARPEREVDHSPPTSAEVRETWIYINFPHASSCCSA